MNKNNINITFFCGGSGCTSFIKYLENFKDVNINLIINGYDYGKSSGKIRKTFPNILGPSDFRKNISLLMNDNNILKEIIDYRIQNLNDYKDLTSISNLKTNNSYISKLIFNLPFNKFIEFSDYIKIFNLHITELKNEEDLENFFKDFSIGNILFTGFFLKNKNFNKALKDFTLFCEIHHNVLNITDGKSLYLYSLNSKGKISNEAEIIENANLEKIIDIFLFENNISNSEINKIDSLDDQEKIIYLNKHHICPNINIEVVKVLQNSDLVIFGPGTQHSSLFPSYLTKNLNEILLQLKCKKIFITNIYFDNDLFFENALTLINKFYFYINNKQNITNNNNLIDFIFLNKFDEDDINLIDYEKYFPSEVYQDKKIKMLDFEGEKGKHLPQLIFEEIGKYSKLNHKFLNNKKNYFLVSIIVPCLNEEKTISTVIQNLMSLNFHDLGLDKEIIIVDGGSNDKSVDICKKFKNIKIYSLNNKKRGEVLNYGISKSKGDIIVTFPSDNEYLAQDIIKIINQLYLKDTFVVYGSRMIKNYKHTTHLKKIYKNNYLLYWISKIGGLLISLLILIFYNKYISDPFTSLKAFRSETIKNIKNNFKSVDYDIYQIIQLTKNRVYINEIEVNYFARSYKEGKKTNIIAGLKSLLVIFRSLFSNSKKN